MKAVFELDKTRVRHSFAAVSESYDSLAALQRMVGYNLIKRGSAGVAAETILDVGCGTGFITEQIRALSAHSSIIGLDIALPMLQVVRSKLAAEKQLSVVCADAERFPFRENCVDQVFSNLALQWCQDLDKVFSDVQRMLRPSGRLLFSTFGPNTLKELKSAWIRVDDHTHVNEFYSAEQLYQFLDNCGFNAIQVETRCYVSSYPDVLALMKELKGIGAHNASRGRNRQLTGKARLQSMMAYYDVFRSNGLIPATFEVIYISATRGDHG